MSKFLIDLPYHKRWWLPDMVHQCNVVLYGDEFYCCVIDSYSGRTRQSMRVKIKADNSHDDLITGFQELAAKKYPKPLRYERKRRG